MADRRRFQETILGVVILGIISSLAASYLRERGPLASRQSEQAVVSQQKPRPEIAPSASEVKSPHLEKRGPQADGSVNAGAGLAPGASTERVQTRTNADELLYPACVFDPISNLRIEPNAQAAVLCSIDTVRTIQVSGTPTEVGKGIWWQTNACGAKGYIANNQVHALVKCAE